MGRYSYTAGALLGVLLTALAAVVIAMRADEIPRVVRVWPLLAALGTSVGDLVDSGRDLRHARTASAEEPSGERHVPCRDGRRPVRGAHIAHQGGGTPLQGVPAQAARPLGRRGNQRGGNQGPARR